MNLLQNLGSEVPTRNGTPLRRFIPRLEALEDRVVPATIAYQVPFGTTGNQAFTGSLGMDFNVNVPIVITELGVFADGGNGLSQPLYARIFNRATGHQVGPTVDFDLGTVDPLIGGSRFKALSAPIILPAGFQGMIEADGFGPGQLNGNSAGATPVWTTNSDGGAISFVGGGSYDGTGGVFPTTPDSGPANRYAAGTFEFNLFTPSKAAGRYH